MSRNLDDLKSECAEYGLKVTPSGKRESKEDFEHALRDFLWNRDHAGEQMLPQYLPMLARQTKGVDAEDVELMWQECMVQEKINGCRGLFHINPFSDGKNHMQSRRISDKTYRLNENTDNVPHLRDAALLDLTGTVLDGELQSPVVSLNTGDVVTQNILQSTIALLNCSPEKSETIQAKFGKLEYKVFDVLFYHGRDVRGLPYDERIKILELIFEVLGDATCLDYRITLLPVLRASLLVSEKKRFFEQIVAEGGEGVMLKRIGGRYECDVRSKGLWKMKKFLEIDAFVTGFLPGEEGKGQEHLAAALVFSAIDTDSGKPVEVASCSAFTIAEKMAWTEKDENGKPRLKKEFYGMVYEIRGQEISSRNFRLTHATPEARRFDKAPEQCAFSLNEWKKIVKEQR